ncbi:MAG: CYTH domain-containing protein [Alistipes sp.]|nr:CYTH domain-containing protein [Alistipes sp.]
MQEIERKYLVRDDSFKQEAFACTRIAQGYLCMRKVTARVRIYGERAYITFKGKSRDGGLSRFEYESSIPLRCAEALLARCRGIIEKYRYLVKVGNHTWEVDLFEGDNAGLVIAEVELQSVEERPLLPTWVWKEVTGNRYYHNSFLVQHPYKEWGGV